MIPALAFIPPDDVVHAFEYIQDTLDDELEGLLDYFEDSYIGRMKRSGRANPKFAIRSWNVYEATLQQAPRTNNMLEGWHNKMQKSIASNHPNLWKLLEVIQKEDRLNKVLAHQLMDGHHYSTTKKYIDYNQRLHTITNKYSKTVSVLQYLEIIAANLKI